MKHSKFIVLLTVLLVAVMAFSSCSGATGLNPNGDAQLDNDLDNEVIADFLNDANATGEAEKITAALNAWKEHADFYAEEPDFVDKTKLNFSEWKTGNENTNDDYISYTLYTNYPFVVLMVNSYKYDSENDTHSRTQTQTVIYSTKYKDMKEPLLVAYPEYVEEPETLLETKVEYEFIPGINMIKVNTSVLTEKAYDPVPADPEAPLTYKEYVLNKVAYVKSNGDEFVSFDTSTDVGYDVEMSEKGPYYYLTIKDKVYVADEETLYSTYDLGLALELPVYYADYTFDGYKYFIDDSRVQVLNANSITVAYAKLPRAYAYRGESVTVKILANGNIFVQELLATDSNTFDVKLPEGKFNVRQYIIDYKTGAVTELEEKFIVREMETKNSTTSSTFVTEGNIVSAVDFEKGKSVNGDLKYYVLNDDMTVKAELPELFKNQNGLIQFIINGAALVNLELGDYDVICKVDRNGKCSLLPSPFDAARVIYTPFIYIIGNKIYDYNVNDYDKGLITDKLIDGSFFDETTGVIYFTSTVEEDDENVTYYNLSRVYAYKLSDAEDSDWNVTFSSLRSTTKSSDISYRIIGNGVIEYKSSGGDYYYCNMDGVHLFTSIDEPATMSPDGLFFKVKANSTSYSYYFVK